jgi:outer membrane biosynthesis protein TonB
VYWLVLAALGNALTAIVACAGLAAGVWFMARGSRADAGAPVAGADEPPPAAPLPVADPEEPAGPPATTFRHGAIRLVGAPATEDAAPAPEPVPAPEPAPAPKSAPAPKPAPEPEASPPPAHAPPPPPQGPPTSFRQGRIRLGEVERGSSSHPTADEPPDAG